MKIRRVPDGLGVVYKYKGKRYVEIPKRTYIKYYDVEHGDTYATAVVKKIPIIRNVLLVLAIIATVIMTLRNPAITHNVRYLDDIYTYKNNVCLNLVNDAKNTNDIIVQLYYNNTAVTDSITLSPGEKVSLVDNIYGSLMRKGLYKCTLKYEIVCKQVSLHLEYPVNLRVE